MDVKYKYAIVRVKESSVIDFFGLIVSFELVYSNQTRCLRIPRTKRETKVSEQYLAAAIWLRLNDWGWPARLIAIAAATNHCGPPGCNHGRHPASPASAPVCGLLISGHSRDTPYAHSGSIIVIGRYGS
ncbi:hypothetical protein Aduo_011835 [Ancylostoma duodenale]